jgi:DNA-binding CsgD family transcriptional regulator
MDSTADPPSPRIASADRQAVLDAAAVLQVRRTEIATALADGRRVKAEIVDGSRDSHGQILMMHEQERWSELLSVRPEASTTGLRGSLPNTRMLLAAGMRMISVYDLYGTPPDARLVLAGETQGTYLLSVAPVQMKIVNRDHVLLQGPFRDGEDTVMAVRSPACLDAAWRYWEAVHKAAIPVDEAVDPLGDLTPRQRQVVALLATGVGDDTIAAALGVSVRTVRSDVARILDALGVQSRFAAGVRLQLWSDGAEG